MVMKGKPITAVGGKYKGLIGWVNTQKAQTKTRIPVILQLDNGHLKATAISKDNVKRRKIPENKVEAILQQHADINKLVDKLAMAMCECNILDTGDIGGFQNILIRKMKQASQIRVQLGDDADHRFVGVDEIPRNPGMA